MLKNKVEELERQHARLSGTESFNQQRIKEVKEERDKLQDKCHKL
jgi:hypothetical protein